MTRVRLNRATDRDSTDAKNITLNIRNRRFSTTAEGYDYWIGGADYQINKSLVISYQHAELQDVYSQSFIGLVNKLDVGPGGLKSDLRYMLSDDAGAARGGKIDSRALNGMFTYILGRHALGVGLQKMNSSTSMPYINGIYPYLTYYIQINIFAESGERSCQLRYDYDFAAMGLLGLPLMTR